MADVLVTDDGDFGRLFNRLGDSPAITLKAFAIRVSRRHEPTGCGQQQGSHGGGGSVGDTSAPRLGNGRPRLPT